MQDYQNRSEKMSFSFRREKWYYGYVVYFVLLFLEVVILFLLSRAMSKTLSRFMSINLLSFLLSPGVIIHELSHLLMAVILFVPVGNMEFTPKRNDNEVKLGSVEIAKTDPIRRSLIGFSPVLLGLMLTVSLVYFVSTNLTFLQNQNPYIIVAVIFVLAYLLFVISNTMFSSSKDMEGTVEILLALLLIFGAAYLLGFRIPLTILNQVFTKEFLGIIQKSTLFLLAPIAVDLIILGTVRIFRKI